MPEPRAAGSATRAISRRKRAHGGGAEARAVAYLELRVAGERTLFGVGIDKNIVVASLKAVVSGVNRAGKR